MVPLGLFLIAGLQVLEAAFQVVEKTHPSFILNQRRQSGTTKDGMKPFIIGVLIGLFVLFPLAVYLFARLGYMSLATSARPLPGEEFLAQTALRASIGAAADQKNPLAATDENFLA